MSNYDTAHTLALAFKSALNDYDSNIECKMKEVNNKMDTILRLLATQEMEMEGLKARISSLCEKHEVYRGLLRALYEKFDIVLGDTNDN